MSDRETVMRLEQLEHDTAAVSVLVEAMCASQFKRNQKAFASYRQQILEQMEKATLPELSRGNPSSAR